MNQAVAASIRAARRSRGWSQGDLAERMQSAGVNWTRVIAGAAEAGTRNITVDELAALAVVFETTPGYFLAPPATEFESGSPVVEVGKHDLPATWLVASAAAGDAAPSPVGEGPTTPWARFFEVLALVVRRKGLASKDARLLHHTLARLRAATTEEDGAE